MVITMDNLILKEYEMLRSEIEQKISLHNTLLTFIITSTVAVITIAISEGITILYLFPFLHNYSNDDANCILQKGNS